MTGILDEREADKIVIKNLLRELKKRGYMGRILIDPETGDIYLAEHTILLSEDELQKNVERLNNELADIEKAKAASSRVKGSATAPAADQGEDKAAPAPVAPETPAPAPEAPMQQDAPVAPVAEVPPVDNTPRPVVIS